MKGIDLPRFEPVLAELFCFALATWGVLGFCCVLLYGSNREFVVSFLDDGNVFGVFNFGRNFFCFFLGNLVYNFIFTVCL
jgi:hypothetical protein